MRFYPLFLDVARRACLVVGGGAVGTRKVDTLLGCGAAVTVVSPDTTPRIDALAAEGAVTLKRRPYRPGDLQGKFLVIGATDDEALNRRIHHDAQQRGLLCNIADRPEVCNFILPAVVRRGDLVIAISTSGRSPAFAKHLRRRLEGEFGPEYARVLELLGRLRRRLLAAAHAPEAHKPLFEALIAGGLLELVARHDSAGIDRLLGAVLGPGFAYAELMEMETPPREDGPEETGETWRSPSA